MTATKTFQVKVTATAHAASDLGSSVTGTGTGSDSAYSDGTGGGRGGGSTYYANCSAVRAADVTPLHAGDPGYSRRLGRDGDGAACA
ncbi:excalibur calcium-binding domain-containing protein [Streptomyces sp. MK5]|uniref:excalibur calcium-binding domain-containing protein n=1 Tax=Streptomyces sp. MK5 TaxID=3064253 RepID=UPI003557F230